MLKLMHEKEEKETEKTARNHNSFATGCRRLPGFSHLYR